MTRRPHATPPDEADRQKAREAAAALRRALADHLTLGDKVVAHLDFSRPRRGQWWTTWSGVPGFTRVDCSRDGRSYHHECLPGWQYARNEIVAEMIPDLEALAERGERPRVAT